MRRDPFILLFGCIVCIVGAGAVACVIAACAQGLGPLTPITEADASDSGAVLNDGGVCVTTCGADPHSLYCNESPVATCTGTEACANGTCIDACSASAVNQSTVGCEYFAVTPEAVPNVTGACYAAFVVNTWTAPTTITVEYDGKPLDVSSLARIPKGTGPGLTYAPLENGQLKSGEIAILFLSRAADGKGVSCPGGVTPGVNVNPAPQGTSFGRAFRIATTAPVVAYDIFPYGGGSSALTGASLLLPTSSWANTYVAVEAYEGVSGSPLNPFLDVVATHDGTKVELYPNKRVLPGTGIPGGQSFQSETFTLDRGQVLHVRQYAELTGSIVRSDSPIGLWGGSTCMLVPNPALACDAAHQQIPPVRALGHEYAAARHRNRFPDQDEPTIWQVVGVVAGTELTYDPAPPPDAPTVLYEGDAFRFKSSDPFVVRSQDKDHPFYLAGYMTGAQVVMPNGSEDGRGDPEWVGVVSTQQYLSRYVFFTDPTYPETNLVFVRSRAQDNAFKDVALDCLTGPVGGWMPIGKGDYEYARVDLSTGNFTGVGGCDNGRHEVKSDGPFTLTVWGWGSAATGGELPLDNDGNIIDAGVDGFYSQFVSYAYPAGASVQPINQVAIPPH